MNEQANIPPPPPRGGGCCGLGCMTVLGLVIFLLVAFIGGFLWAVHHVRDTYSEKEPVEMPEVVTSDAPIAVDNSAPPDAAATAAPTPVTARQVETRWKTFEKAADHHQKARIELSAGEINALLQTGKNTRGKVFVSIENNVGHVRFSIPVKNVPMMKGRYVNGEASVETSPDGDPEKARVTNIVLANNSVSDAFLDRSLFGWPSLRKAISDWLNGQEVTSLRIEDNRVIGETSGDR